MTNRATTASVLVLAAAFLLLAPSPKAAAQCAPGAWLCASVHIGGAIGWRRRYRRRAQVVVVQPAPPPRVVYVQPAPPPPPPPPVVVVQPQPQPTYYVAQTQQPTQFVAAPPAPRQSSIGLHAALGYMGTGRIQIGGVSGALRLRRPGAHLALDLGIGAYGGTDYNGAARTEVPLTADGLFFFNPQNRWQLYALLGVGASWAHTQNNDGGFTTLTTSRDYSYVGAETGLGLEWRLSPYFALDGEIRGFIRQRVDGNPAPEFVDATTGQTTNTSGGVLTTLGLTLYL